MIQHVHLGRIVRIILDEHKYPFKLGFIYLFYDNINMYLYKNFSLK